MTPESDLIRFSGHALEQLVARGGTVEEVEITIRTAVWGPADLGRLECRKSFPYDALWNGRMYATKQVRPIFVNNPREIVVITVYVYYS